MVVATLTRTFYATDYGARGDGATDDAPRLRDAINAAVAQGGGRVILPVASVVLIGSTVALPAGVELVVPISCTLRLAPAANADMLSVAAAGVKISGGGTIDGSRATQTAGTPHGISANGATDLLVDDVIVTGCRGNGINLAASSRVELRGVTVTDCGTHGIALASSSRCVVANSASYDNSKVSAIGVGDGVNLSGTSADNAVLGLVAYDSAGAGGRQGYAVREAAGMTGDRNVFASVAGSGNVTGQISTVGASSGLQSGSPTGVASGDLAGNYPGPTFAAARIDPVAANYGARTLGGGAQQAMPGTGAAALQTLAVPGNVSATAYLIKVSGTGTATLPDATAVAVGKPFEIKKTDGGTTTTLGTTGGQTIDGAATYALTVQWQSVTVRSDGANWLVT